MMLRVLAVAFGCLACTCATADELDQPPTPNEDPYCLERKAAREAYLRGISNVTVSDGQMCPPDPEKLRQRESACRATRDESVPWQFISDGFESGSSMLPKGVPYIVDELGEPDRVEQRELGWDIDVFEIQRTLYFPGITVVTRDFISNAVDFDAASGTAAPTDMVYEMLVEHGDYRFAHGLTLGSTREDVEIALGLPCRAVAHAGRTAVRRQESYAYSDLSDAQKARYTVTFRFDDAGHVQSLHWYYDAVWH